MILSACRTYMNLVNGIALHEQLSGESPCPVFGKSWFPIFKGATPRGFFLPKNPLSCVFTKLKIHYHIFIIAHKHKPTF